MTAPTIITQRYLILPETAQAAALGCQHEWRELDGGEDDGIGFLAILQGTASKVLPCRHCVAALAVVEGRDGKTYPTAILRDAPEP